MNEETQKYGKAQVHKETIYDNGLFQGRRYKAWEIILDTPNEFIELFNLLKDEAILQNVTRIYKDIANRLFYPQGDNTEHTEQTPINLGYIELKQNESQIKGNEFYNGFIKWMTEKGPPELHYDIFNRVEEYCKSKIEEIKETSSTKELRNNNTQFEEPDFLLGKIANEFKQYKPAFNTEADYQKSVELIHKFISKKPIKIEKIIFVKSGYIRKFAFALGEIWRSHTNDIITIEYLQFYRQLFTIFQDQIIDESNVFSNNLYKYSLSKT